LKGDGHGMIKIALFTAYYSPEPILGLTKEFKDVKFDFCKDTDELKASLKDAHALITIPCSEELLEGTQQLKWVQSLRAGVDNYPLGILHEKGIVLTSAKGIHRVHMAEYAVAMMIMMARNLHVIHANRSSKKWYRRIPQDEINGKTVCILGLGRIGSELAKKASLMGMRVLGVKRNSDPVEYVDKVYTPGDIEQFLPQSDYVVNLMPYTPATEKIIDMEYFSLMKPDAVFLNLGRGRTVNEKELIEALQKGMIRGLVADVFYDEPLPQDSPLWTMENAIITPHICGESVNYLEKTLEVIRPNLKAFITGQGQMVNQVDLKTGY